jgi:hypothetical protein
MPEILGKLQVKYDTQSVSEKFKKRDLVIATDLNTPYPQYIIAQVSQDKCSVLDSFNEGDEVKAQYNLKGRSWNSPQGVKYFNTIEIWKIEKTGSVPNAVNEGMNMQSNSNMNDSHQAPVFNNSIDEGDGLPF